MYVLYHLFTYLGYKIPPCRYLGAPGRLSGIAPTVPSESAGACLPSFGRRQAATVT